jgi:TRAP-type C4-dicarboxylate transport system permease small subunit
MGLFFGPITSPLRRRNMNILDKVRRANIMITETVTVVLFSFIIVLMALQVFFRYFLGASLSWSEEITRFLFVWLIYMGMVIAINRGEHAVMDIVVKKLQGKLRLAFTLLAQFTTLVFFGIVIYQGTKLMMLTSVQRSPAIGIPMVLVYLALPLGSILGAIEVVLQILEEFKECNSGGVLSSKGETDL